MKKILLSIISIAAVSVLVFGVSRALFFDTETSTGNTFTAGAVDLKVDSEQHYNNAVCVKGKWALEENAVITVPQYPVIGTDCDGTWGQTNGNDIVNEKFFNFADVKPGDSGENTVSLHVLNNDAWVCAEVSNLASNDVSLTEPETLVDIDGMTSGELDDAMVWTIWKDDGDNIQQENEPTLLSGKPVNGVLSLYDSTTGAGPMAGLDTAYLGVKWELPLATGNEVQTDSLTGDISFHVEQARNNPNFRCIPPPVDSDGDGDPDITDCQINDKTVFHGATEVFNDKDDDCDGLINEGIVGWVKPTSYMDAAESWNGEWLLYDGVLGSGSYGGSYSIPGNSWGSFLELNLPAETTSNQVRFYIPFCAGTCGFVNQINVDVFRNGAWTDVYQGAFNTSVWETKSFTSGSVNKARISVFNSGSGSGTRWIDEFEFYANN